MIAAEVPVIPRGLRNKRIERVKRDYAHLKNF